jgi:transposase
MLKRLDTMTEKQRVKFDLINQSNTMTAKAWKMRENFLELYQCPTQEEAKLFFERWYLNVIHSNIPALKKAAKTIKRYIEGIITQIGNTISNARAEQTNSKIAKLQRMAQGYSNFNNLRAAILFFNASLDLFSHD